MNSFTFNRCQRFKKVSGVLSQSLCEVIRIYIANVHIYRKATEIIKDFENRAKVQNFALRTNVEMKLLS